MEAMQQQHIRQPLGRRTNQDEKKTTAQGNKKKQQQQFGDRSATENATPSSFRRAIRATLTPRSMLSQEIQLSADTSYISLSSPALEMASLPPAKGKLTATTISTTTIANETNESFVTALSSPLESEQVTVKSKSSIFKSTLQKFSEAPRQTGAPVNHVNQKIRTLAPALVVDTCAIPLDFPLTKQIPTSQGDASLDAALIGLMEAVMTPPSTSKSAGVCMDLSSMFCEAAQGTAPPKKPPIPRKHSSSFVPGRSHGSQKKSRSIKMKPISTVSPMQLMPATTTTTTTSADEKKNKEAWASQQEETFTTFLNYILCPPDEAETLQWYQRYAKARLKARAVFIDMSTARDTLLSEISSGRVTIRTDKDIHADLTVRAEVMELFHAFQPQWLRLGVETMLGDMPNSMSVKDFIIERLLSDRKLLRKYTRGKCKVPSGRFEKEYKQEMRQLVLYRILVLFFFLEKAKLAECFDQPLFNTSSKYKATKDILNALSRIVLHGQGNFARHLERQGLNVVYKQSPVDELDFRIINLATDLRDGSRLARWTEELLHLPRFELIQKLELPAGSRLQKIRNLQRVLGQLVHLIPDNKVLAHHIVDGYRDRVFLLLWSLLAKSCLDDLLPVVRVHEEIERLEKLRSFSTFSALPSDLKSSLLIWADLVCRRFGRAVQNWTSSFFDGVAVCMLIHYYHPRLLRIEDIDYTEQSASENAKRANKVLLHLGGMPHQIVPANPSEESMLLALTCLCSRLMSSSAEDRATRLIQFAYRAFIERKMEHRRKDAARVIWSAWEKHRDVYYASQRYTYAKSVAVLERFVLRYKKRFSQLRQSRQQTHHLATVIQKYVRGFLARKQSNILLLMVDAAVTIQVWWTRVMVQKVKRDDAAFTIQCCWRNSLSRLRQELSYVASRVIQRYWRGYRARRHFKMVQSACKIQRMWKVFLAQVNLQVTFIDIITVQSLARRSLALKKSEKRRHAVYTLQKQARSYLLIRKVREMKRCVRCIQVAYLRYREKALTEKENEARLQAATRIQSAWRRFSAVSQAETLLYSALRIQTQFRRLAATLAFQTRRQKAAIVQSAWRHFIAKKRFDHALRAAVSIQATWRSYSVRRRYLNIVLPAVELGAKRLQALFRGQKARQEFARMQYSAIVLQARIRQKMTEAKYHKARLEITVVQAIFRSYIAVKRYSHAMSCVILCQAAVRKWLSCRQAAERRSCLLRLQCASRQWLANRSMQMIVAARKNETSAVELIQRQFRGYLPRREICNLRANATQIQRVFRGHAARISYYIELVDIVIVQSVARMWVARRVLAKREKSIVMIQTAFRMYSMKKKFCRSLAITSATKFLQRFVRGYLARARLKRELAAIKLQKTWRCYTKHVDYMMAILGCIQIQAAARGFIAKSVAARRRTAVDCLQSFARRIIATRQVEKEAASAVKIQTMMRRFLVRSKFLVKKLATTQMQKIIRGHIQRADLALQHFAATQIQGAWRTYVSITYFICMELSAVTIQAQFRCWLGKRRAEMLKAECLAHRFNLERSVRLIQHCYRDYSQRLLEHKSAALIAKCWKNFLSQRTFRKMRIGLIQLQSAFRGFSLRSKDPQARGRLQRIAVAVENSRKNPDLRLCNKTRRALNRLRKSTGLSDILESIQVLERATRYSRQCCTAFTRAGAPDILFSLVRSCNRSLPHVELLEWILLTVSNVAKYDELTNSVATLTGVRIYLDLLQMFRDKEVVFSLSAALLFKSIKSNAELLHYCRTTENKKRLRAVYDVVSSRRQHALSDNSNRNRSSRHGPKQFLVLARNKEATHSVAQRILHKVLNRIQI